MSTSNPLTVKDSHLCSFFSVPTTLWKKFRPLLTVNSNCFVTCSIQRERPNIYSFFASDVSSCRSRKKLLTIPRTRSTSSLKDYSCSIRTILVSFKTITWFLLPGAILPQSRYFRAVEAVTNLGMLFVRAVNLIVWVSSKRLSGTRERQTKTLTFLCCCLFHHLTSCYILFCAI
jgi:hypothetical protein